MFYDILSKERLDILPLLKNFSDDFYLAGGTALALQIGHRDSVDFDFFSSTAFDTAELFEKIRAVFSDHRLLTVQNEENTLTVVIDENIKLSFFYYAYPLVEPLIEAEYFRLASLTDIGCMKLSAIVGRATSRDYVDLYFIMQKISLSTLLDFAGEKMPELDRNLILKSLVYFEDLPEEALIFRNNSQIDFVTIKNFLISELKKLTL